MFKGLGYSLKQALQQIFRNKGMAIASLFAITAMLLILGLFFFLTVNVNFITEEIKDQFDTIEVFLQDDQTEAQADVIRTSLSKLPGVESVEYIDKARAMEEFKVRWGDNAYLLDGLSTNPLPNSLRVTLTDLNEGDVVAEVSRNMTGVEDVRYYQTEVNKILKVSEGIQKGALVVIAFLIIVSVVVGIVLTLPISSAAICMALGLTGLAGGAAVAGCSANMVGFAVASFRENKWGGLVSQGLGTSMLQMPNIVKNPRVWLPAILASAITGPLSTCLFKLEMNGAPVSSGMGTCGFVGQIGMITGWYAPVESAVAQGATAITPGVWEWLGLILISFVLPALLSWAFGNVFRKIGWIKEGDMKLEA